MLGCEAIWLYSKILVSWIRKTSYYVHKWVAETDGALHGL